ncbi:MAG: S8 family serine peptidase [Bacteroidota bacterium]
MKYINQIIAVVLCIFSLTSTAQDASLPSQELYLKLADSYPIEFNTDSPEVNIEEQVAFLQPFIERYQIASLESSFYFAESELLKRTLRFSIPNEVSIDAIIESLSSLEEVEYAEPVPIYELTYTPNDLGGNSTGAQWYLHRINAKQAWDVTRGDNIVVAVVDNAFQLNHPDLAGNFVAGRDVADNDNNPNIPNTSFTHGTHVAGLVGASTDNGLGIASIGYNIDVMPIKATRSSYPPNFITNGYEGITWAAQNGADVINCSWGGGGYSTTGQNVINTAHNLGAVIVASAGNGSSSSPSYPAAYNHIISVASTYTSDQKSNFSNYGTWVDIAAPGQNIRSTLPLNTYGNMSGTSMAAPIVAGLCGLILSADPSMSSLSVEQCLENTADNIDAANPSYIGQLGAGRINAYQAVLCASASCPNFVLTSPSDDIYTSIKYEADQYIIASNAIFGGADAEYDAGNYIELNAGFSAEIASVFEAYIDGCGGLRSNGGNATEQRSILEEEMQEGKITLSSIEIYPNPFRTQTTISYELSQSSHVRAGLFDAQGRKIRVLLSDTVQEAGKQQLLLNSEDLSAGLYYCQLQIGDQLFSKKLVLVE